MQSQAAEFLRRRVQGELQLAEGSVGVGDGPLGGHRAIGLAEPLGKAQPFLCRDGFAAGLVSPSLPAQEGELA